MVATSKKVIGILGGVGPMAGVQLHKLIIQNTLNGGTDQGHLTIFHHSESAIIPDRTAFLLGQITNDPAVAMCNVAGRLTAGLEGKEMIAGVPCNTFHAPKIWNHFIRLLKEGNINVRLVHMLKETAKLIQDSYPGITNIGLMSTTGTRQVNVYGEILTPLGYKILEVPEKLQDKLHDSIYNPDWGIKAVSPVSKQARSNFEKYTQLLIQSGAQAIILGCTEIPLALPQAQYQGVPLVDPMLALARALIREANY